MTEHKGAMRLESIASSRIEGRSTADVIPLEACVDMSGKKREKDRAKRRPLFRPDVHREQGQGDRWKFRTQHQFGGRLVLIVPHAEHHSIRSRQETAAGLSLRLPEGQGANNIRKGSQLSMPVSRIASAAKPPMMSRAKPAAT